MTEQKELPKRWDPKLEEEILRSWEQEKLYKFDPNSGKPLVVVDTPPPYPGPFWHIGAAIHYALQDVFVRGLRMLGYEVFFPIGFDRNGIPVEWYVEKYEGVDLKSKTREEVIEICSKALDKYQERMYSILRRLGCSYNWGPYRTDNPDYRMLTQQTFAELWKRGLIYEDLRPNCWCPRCRTTIAEAEVEYKEVEGELYYIDFDLEDGGKITIATTRPELLPACKLIIFNPEDERYRHLEGKHAIVPIFGQKVPIMARKEANPEFGTGIVMICSYGDFTDVAILRELGIKPTIVIDLDGKMKDCGKYSGMTVEAARKAIVEDLKKEGRLVKVEKIKHRVPVHDKCKTRIEIIPMKEWYLKQKEFLEDLKNIVDEIEFIPEKYRQDLLNWINAVTQDWPISRRRYYGTEIPMWYCKNCGYIYVPHELNKYVQPWREDPDIACPNCGSREWVGEKRTLDTWMDSSISVLYITKDFPGLFESAIRIRPQGKDIIRTWLYYTLLRVYQLKGVPAFHRVWITGMGLDEKGRKMSKSLGNVIYPEPLLEKYGADAIRFFAVMECSIGEDYRISESKIMGALKFLTKLINIARFISQFEFPEEKPELTPTDKWILGLFNKVRERCLESYKKLDAHIAAMELRGFLWNIFASHYIEMVKRRAKGEGDFTEEEIKAARWTLHTILRGCLLLLAPICPFITDYIWRKMYGESIHTKLFPEKIEDAMEENIEEITEKIVEFNSTVWKMKKEKGLPLTAEIEIEIPDELKMFEKDLRAMHRIKTA